jgi:hypothetical protein
VRNPTPDDAAAAAEASLEDRCPLMQGVSKVHLVCPVTRFQTELPVALLLSDEENVWVSLFYLQKDETQSDATTSSCRMPEC